MAQNFDRYRRAILAKIDRDQSDDWIWQRETAEQPAIAWWKFATVRLRKERENTNGNYSAPYATHRAHGG